MKKLLKFIIFILLPIFIIGNIVLYFNQEKFMFFPTKLDKNYVFGFDNSEEINIKAKDGTTLNSLLFKTENPKGLIFYLHGNAGALNTWGQIAPFYNSIGYDFFIMDYRGFGKSDGSISSQKQLFDDAQSAYDDMKKRYAEANIIIAGYSIGTGIAAHLAADNPTARMLILHAPYYSMESLVKEIAPALPSFLLRYKIPTYEYAAKCKMPIVLFHGDKDEVIDYENSVRLKSLLKSTDKLIIIEGENHNGITDNIVYREELAKELQ